MLDCFCKRQPSMARLYESQSSMARLYKRQQGRYALPADNNPAIRSVTCARTSGSSSPSYIAS